MKSAAISAYVCLIVVGVASVIQWRLGLFNWLSAASVVVAGFAGVLLTLSLFSRRRANRARAAFLRSSRDGNERRRTHTWNRSS